MANNFKLNVKSCNFVAALAASYDLGVGIVGYEYRASFCPQRFRAGCKIGIALRYGTKTVKSFRANNEHLETAGFEILDLDSGSEARAAEYFVKEAILRSSSEHIRMIVDVSSMSRKTMVGTVTAILGSGLKTAEVVFTYSVASFEKPPKRYPPLVEFGAIDPAFGGAPRGADKYTALILGVGYEAGRAIAAYNRVDPEETWVLFPLSHDRRYNQAVEEANRDLLSLSETIKAVKYDVKDPVFLYEKVRSLAVGLRRDHRLVFIPSGPKLCALMTFLVAIDIHPDVSVWRMSSGPLEPLFNRKPSGEGVAVTVIFNLN